jgi:arylsulfatase A-like enzyme/Flp pilus assembly protein TadD
VQKVNRSTLFGRKQYRWRSLLALLMTWYALSASALPCATGNESQNDTTPNLLLITVDTLRADAISYTGRKLGQTPTIDRLAANGRVFANTRAHSVTTLPSHASILTGLYPYEHGARENGGFRLDPAPATLATLARSVGFRTAAFVGAFPLDSRFGLDRGFEVYDDDLPARGVDRVMQQIGGYSERPATTVVERAWTWWEEHRGQRRFLWIHLYEPHVPYEPPEPYLSRFRGRPYIGEVAAVDGALAPVLDRFLSGKEEPTLIVLTSDHGEALGSHGERTHGLFAYEATLRVPLIFWGPGVKQGTDKTPSRLVDVLPSIAGRLSIEVPPGLPGRSLLAGAMSESRDISYFEALSAHLDFDWAPLYGVVDGKWKLIQLPIPELYDLEVDPQESHNLFSIRQDEARRLASQIPIEATRPVNRTVSAEDAERLRSLGYLVGDEGSDREFSADDDPKKLVHLDQMMATLPQLFSSGQLDKGVELAGRVISERPSMSLAHLYLARFLLRQGKLEAALASLRNAESIGIENPELTVQLALVLTQSGQAQEAIDLLDKGNPGANEADLVNARAMALQALDRVQEAEDLLTQRIESQPYDAGAHESLSFIALQSQRYRKAKEHAEAALSIDESRPDAWNNLGVALYWLGEKTRALEAWEHALELVPETSDVLLSYGLTSAEVGRPKEAREALQLFLKTATSPRYDEARRQAETVLRQLDLQ